MSSLPSGAAKPFGKKRNCNLVLDASALLALLLKEQGGDAVRAVLSRSLMSTVNLAEVATYFTNRGVPIDEVRASLAQFELLSAPFDEDLALTCAMLRPLTRHLGLSLGDRACLALARRVGEPALTADRMWAGLDVGVEIRLIR